MDATQGTNAITSDADALNNSLDESEWLIGSNINPIAKVFFIIVGSLEVVSGVFGNCLLLSVLLRRRTLRMRCVHNFFIVNLALSDLVSLGYWMVFFVLDLILGYHPVANMTHCRINGFIIGVFYLAATLSLLSIAFNRYLHVCHQRLYARFFSLPRTLTWCVSLYLAGVVVALPPLLGVGSFSYNHDTHFCSFNRTDPNKYAKVMVIVFSVVPLCFVGYWNFAIFRYWRKARANLKRNFSNYPVLNYGRASDQKESRGKLITNFKKRLSRKKENSMRRTNNVNKEIFSAGCTDTHETHQEVFVEASTGVEVSQSHSEFNPFISTALSAPQSEERRGDECVIEGAHNMEISTQCDLEDTRDKNTETDKENKCSKNVCPSQGQLENKEDSRLSSVTSDAKKDLPAFDNQNTDEISDLPGNEASNLSLENRIEEQSVCIAESDPGEKDTKITCSSEDFPLSAGTLQDETSRSEITSCVSQSSSTAPPTQLSGGRCGAEWASTDGGHCGGKLDNVSGYVHSNTEALSTETPHAFVTQGRKEQLLSEQMTLEATPDIQDPLPIHRGEEEVERLEDRTKTTAQPNRFSNGSKKYLKRFSSESNIPKHTSSTFPLHKTSCHLQYKPSLHVQQLHRKQEKRRAKEEAFVRSLFIVFLLIVFSFIPYGITMIVDSLTPVPPEVGITSDLILFFNNAVNWIVYGVLNPSYRRGYVTTLRRLMKVCQRQTKAEENLSASLSSLKTLSTQRMNSEVEVSESMDERQFHSVH